MDCSQVTKFVMPEITANVGFIVGSPRSGTTLLGDILDLHPHITQWYEPHYVLDRHFRKVPNDCRVACDATEKVQRSIKKSFDLYRKHYRRQVIVDKSPGNSLKISFLRAIFPDAKFIHMLRDGRDATLSIAVEWKKRTSMIGDRSLNQIARTLLAWLNKYDRFEHKLGALLYDFGDFSDLLRGGWRVARWTRWGVSPGWGPQFEGWQEVVAKVSPLEFNALQWAKCVDAVLTESQQLNHHRFFEVRYETLLAQPEATLKKIFDFLEVETPLNFAPQLPSFKNNNCNKWKTAFSDSEKALIGPILNPLLVRLGYASDSAWYSPVP